MTLVEGTQVKSLLPGDADVVAALAGQLQRPLDFYAVTDHSEQLFGSEAAGLLEGERLPGPEGCGKSHLLNGLCHAARAQEIGG